MTFYFFDLETSGFSGRHDRIMQFAGQRTDENLKPIGGFDNFLIKMTPDVLPQPEAVLVHGITPQKTISEGISEADFCRYLTSQVSVKDTVMVGYNNIRFDNEFIRFTLWRNFYDAYEWSWKDNCSIWDLLDVVRMTRALRPDGINWPFAIDGKPTVKLEFLSAVNKLTHDSAHDALSDVRAVIEVAKLIRSRQPKLFNYLLNHRKKDKIAPLVESGRPVVYTSGRYPGKYEKTTVAIMVAKVEGRGALVYDLRVAPMEFLSLSAAQLAAKWSDFSEEAPYFPIKLMAYNKCPAVAPLSVLDSGSLKRLQINLDEVESNRSKLKNSKDFADKLLKAFEIMQAGKQTQITTSPLEVDGLLYEGFVNGADKSLMDTVRSADAKELAQHNFEFKDERLKLLLPLYKARNFPKLLNMDEKIQWDDFLRRKLINSGFAARYFKKLQELTSTSALDEKKRYLIEELSLYAQSLIPISTDAADDGAGVSA